MKTMMSLVAVLLLCSCVYEAPLVEEAVIPVDPQLTGVWKELAEEGKAEDPDDRMVILPFSKTEYVVIRPPGHDALYFRAYPIRVEGLELLQLEWLQADPDGDERYQVCRYAVQDGVLTVKTLNEDVISDEIKDSAALREALLASRDNPDLFEEPDRYRKLED